MNEETKIGLIQAGVLKARKAAATLGAAGAVTLATVTPALAADVDAAVESFGLAATAIGLIGSAMVAAAGAGIVYRWVTAFMVK